MGGPRTRNPQGGTGWGMPLPEPPGKGGTQTHSYLGGTSVRGRVSQQCHQDAVSPGQGVTPLRLSPGGRGLGGPAQSPPTHFGGKGSAAIPLNRQNLVSRAVTPSVGL